MMAQWIWKSRKHQQTDGDSGGVSGVGTILKKCHIYDVPWVGDSADRFQNTYFNGSRY